MYLFPVASSTTSETLAANRDGTQYTTPTSPSERGNSLVYAPNATCDDFWRSWPAVNEKAIADGTVLVFDVFNSVGNLFVTFDAMIKVDSRGSASTYL